MLDDVKINFPGIDTDTFNPDIMRFLKQKTNLTWCGFYLPVVTDAGASVVAAAKVWHNQRAFMKSLGWGLAPIYIGKQHDGTKLPALVQRKLPADQLSEELKKEGNKDGTEAVQGALAEGFRAPTVIYFDVEHDWNPKSAKDAFKEYIRAWCQTIQKAGFNPGIYCVKEIAADLHNAVGPAFIWAVNYNHGLTPHGDGGSFQAAQDKKAGRKPRPIGQKVDLHPNYPVVHPKTSGYPAAIAWQMAGNCFIPAKMMNSSGHEPKEFIRIKVDVNTSVFADPGMPFPIIQQR